ncbi:hypothetical protein BHE74_00017258 [Ensete ventricosum]|nr:hypothetical protein BHE74_00017258 [Ensete ventricosum]RZR84664.1 hypothetical protein BHM03_00011517 [Ensete ventricosum]
MYTAVAEEGSSGMEREMATIVGKIDAGSFLPQGSLLATIKEDGSKRSLLAALGSERCVLRLKGQGRLGG